MPSKGWQSGVGVNLASLIYVQKDSPIPTYFEGIGDSLLRILAQWLPTSFAVTSKKVQPSSAVRLGAKIMACPHSFVAEVKSTGYC